MRRIDGTRHYPDCDCTCDLSQLDDRDHDGYDHDDRCRGCDDRAGPRGYLDGYTFSQKVRGYLTLAVFSVLLLVIVTACLSHVSTLP